MVESMNLQEKSNTFQKESETLTLPLTVSGICRVLGVNQTIQDKPISAICVDKNKAVEGCAFIAIKSKDSDMVKNVETVVSKGCAVVISETQIKDFDCIIVNNAREAMATLARCYKSCFNFIRVGVTGSYGKTVAASL